MRADITPIQRLEIYKLRQSGESNKAVAEQYSVSPNVVAGVYFRHCEQIKGDNARLEACELLDAGKSDYEIAQSTCVNIHEVARLREALGAMT